MAGVAEFCTFIGVCGVVLVGGVVGKVEGFIGAP